MIQEGSAFVHIVMAEFISGNYVVLSLTCRFDSIAVNRFLDITNPENWVEMKLLVDQKYLSVGFFGRHMWIITAKNKYISCSLTLVHVCHMLWGLSLLVLSLLLIWHNFVFWCFIINSGKKMEKIKWCWAVIHCCSWTTLLRKTVARKVADLRMTILMPNCQFHSGSYVFSCLMCLRMVS